MTITHGNGRPLASFSVPGRPASKNAWLTGHRASKRRYLRYREAVCVSARRAMRGQRPVLELVSVSIIYIAPAHGERCDLDNVPKSVLDGMRRVVFDDDCQVWELLVRRVTGSELEERVEVVVTALSAAV